MDTWAELADDWEGPVDIGAEPANVPATTTTTLPSEGSTLISLLVVVGAPAAVVVDCPMPQCNL